MEDKCGSPLIMVFLFLYFKNTFSTSITHMEGYCINWFRCLSGCLIRPDMHFPIASCSQHIMVSSNYGLSTERPHRSLLGLDCNNQSDSSSLHSIDLFREGVTQHGIYIYSGCQCCSSESATQCGRHIISLICIHFSRITLSFMGDLLIRTVNLLTWEMKDYVLIRTIIHGGQYRYL
jgi:hypothetical protein